MICDICKQREATIHLRQTGQDKVNEYHVCQQCAHEHGLDQSIQSHFSHFLSGEIPGVGNIFNPAGGIPEFGRPGSQDVSCSNCGQTYSDFRKTGLFGCSKCYQTFADRLDPVFRRVQGNVRHSGRKLAQSKDEQAQQAQKARLLELRDELKKLVSEEAYERAAKVRDEIHSLEDRINQTGGEGS